MFIVFISQAYPSLSVAIAFSEATSCARASRWRQALCLAKSLAAALAAKGACQAWRSQQNTHF